MLHKFVTAHMKEQWWSVDFFASVYAVLTMTITFTFSRIQCRSKSDISGTRCSRQRHTPVVGFVTQWKWSSFWNRWCLEIFSRLYEVFQHAPSQELQGRRAGKSHLKLIHKSGNKPMKPPVYRQVFGLVVRRNVCRAIFTAETFRPKAILKTPN
jgi:hypothetical protein